MSDPAATVEIEDVLASVRRLVSANRRVTPRPPVDAEPEKLVLTPDFRVEGSRPGLDHQAEFSLEDDGTESAPEPRPEEGAAVTPRASVVAANVGPSRLLTLEERIAQLEAAVMAHATASDFEPDGSEDQAQNVPHGIVGHVAVSDEAEDLAARFAEPLEAFDETGDEPWMEGIAGRGAAGSEGALESGQRDEDESRSSLPDAQVDTAGPATAHEADAAPWEDAADSVLEAEALADALAAEDGPDSETGISEPDLPEVALEDLDLADLDLADRELADRERAAPDFTEFDGQAAAFAQDREGAAVADEVDMAAIAEAVGAIDESAWSGDDMDGDEIAAEGPADPLSLYDAEATAAPDAPEPDPVPPTGRTVPFPNRIRRPRPVETERPDDRPEYGDWEERIYDFEPDTEVSGLDFDSDTQEIDEEMLRDMVAEIVREELQGALGERITRNVRKLVRREIMRALSIREFE